MYKERFVEIRVRIEQCNLQGGLFVFRWGSAQCLSSDTGCRPRAGKL